MRHSGIETNIAVTIGCSFFIIIAAGHGIAPLVMMEYWILVSDSYQISLSITDYESAIGAAALSSLLGQVIMLLSFVVRKQIASARILLGGLGILYIGVFMLTNRSLKGEVPAIVSLITSIPFVVSSVIMTRKLFALPSQEKEE